MSAKAQDHHKRLSAFLTEFVFPAEASYEEYRREAGPDDHTVPPVIEELKPLARERSGGARGAGSAVPRHYFAGLSLTIMAREFPQFGTGSV